MRLSKQKDMSVLRETEYAINQAIKPMATLKDYSLQHSVEMVWDLNREAIADRMFKLVIDDVEVILDWEEVLKAGRFI